MFLSVGVAAVAVVVRLLYAIGRIVCGCVYVCVRPRLFLAPSPTAPPAVYTAPIDQWWVRPFHSGTTDVSRCVRAGVVGVCPPVHVDRKESFATIFIVSSCNNVRHTTAIPATPCGRSARGLRFRLICFTLCCLCLCLFCLTVFTLLASARLRHVCHLLLYRRFFWGDSQRRYCVYIVYLHAVYERLHR